MKPAARSARPCVAYIEGIAAEYRPLFDRLHGLILAAYPDAAAWSCFAAGPRCRAHGSWEQSAIEQISSGWFRLRSLHRLPGVIVVSEYDAVWPQRFEQLRREYADAMAAAGVQILAIEHVGSTSVPGLAAKPVIDIDIVVAKRDVAAASQALIGLGFEPEGELGIPLRWAFKAPERLAGTNTYVIVAGSLSLRNHLAVRDILRRDARLREQYTAVKRRVGARSADIDEYGRGKNTMVQQILAAAGLSEAERASIDANQVPSHEELPR